MVKAEELVNQSIEELEAKYEDTCRDIFELTSELRVSRKLEKPHELKEKKKDRARILTVLRQKKNG
ncbi:50S ribosomal protein L29 [Candidatus Neptunochlamydia vexilliferae]|uniref:Large ribosomal subunit protein uL29 n=1 Tax=Candidatus Neptunichlamydia vexilliferae TaxID=1651774 RepID=A0ABS0AXL1_9BACT|nr:50S ribosomal protein L29 [Candidatus Neptunochlamydia vexilliferae]MBF5058874.1 50S ribosomal protein L29 [Candidatus Neptunochlamydia vexilliferae]